MVSRRPYPLRIVSLAIAAACSACPGEDDPRGDAAVGDPPMIEQAIADLRGTDPARADAAYQALFTAGAPAIGPLVSLAESAGPAAFAGRTPIHPESCLVDNESPPVSLIALYLVEAILLGNPTPHALPRLISVEPADERELLSIAVMRYASWWRANETQPLVALRATQPLEGANPILLWLGPVFAMAPPGNGMARPGSDTPRGPGPRMPHPSGERGARVIPTGGTSTKTPFNCLAWAMNCKTDRWLQPGDQPAGAIMSPVPLDTILMGNGYSTTATTCTGPCPAGRGPKAKIIWHVPAGGMPNDGNWIHAMKQETDGDWTSKNGEGPLYDDIDDCPEFVRDHYPPGAGQAIESRCYCK